MARAKNKLFKEGDIMLAEISKSLGHPARIQILKILTLDSPQSCNDIVEQLPLAQATVSQHLSELKISKLITDKREGNKVLYSVNKEMLSKAYKEFEHLLIGFSKNVKQRQLF